MNTIARWVLCGLAGQLLIPAQGADPALAGEVAAVREVLARDRAALRQYTWTERTEVLIKGDVKSSTTMACRYDGWGEVQRQPVGDVKPDDTPQATSKRLANRKKADTADYVERAVSLVRTYLPPKSDQLRALMENGNAALSKAPSGKGRIEFTNYWKEGDLLTFFYDPESKALLKVTVKSYLATPKDPVTLEALFENLADGTNHLASSVLNGPAKKIQVKTQNSAYQKAVAP